MKIVNLPSQINENIPKNHILFLAASHKIKKLKAKRKALVPDWKRADGKVKQRIRDKMFKLTHDINKAEENLREIEVIDSQSFDSDGIHSIRNTYSGRIAKRDMKADTFFDKLGESVNESISVTDERHFGKNGIIIMLDNNGKKTSAIFKNKKNADKFNRNNQEDLKKLLDLAQKAKYPNAIDEVSNVIPDGLADGMSLTDIANKHNISTDNLKSQLKQGIKSELEHTSDIKIAAEIAKDHLVEDPIYYTKLAKMENEGTLNEFNISGLFHNLVNNIKKSKHKDRFNIIDDEDSNLLGLTKPTSGEFKLAKTYADKKNLKIYGVGASTDGKYIYIDIGTPSDSINNPVVLDSHGKYIRTMYESIHEGASFKPDVNHRTNTPNGNIVATIDNKDYIFGYNADGFGSEPYIVWSPDGESRFINKDRIAKKLYKKIQNQLRTWRKANSNLLESLNEAKDDPQIITDLRDIVKHKQYKKVKDPITGKLVTVTLYSASAVITVYDHLKKSNQKKFITTTIPKMIGIAFKVLK